MYRSRKNKQGLTHHHGVCARQPIMQIITPIVACNVYTFYIVVCK